MTDDSLDMTRSRASTDPLLAGGALPEPHDRPIIERRRFTLGMSRFSGILIWIGLIVLFSVWLPDTFATTTTARSIASNQAITAILALGLLFPLAAGVFDLSIAQNMGFSAILSGYLMTSGGLDPAVAVVIALASGVVVGSINGLLVAVIGVNSFIATLGMTSVLLAVTNLISNGEFVGPVADSVQSAVNQEVLGIPMLLVYMLALAVIAWYALEHTPVGRRIQATGANPDAARLAGVRTGRYVFFMFVICGVTGSLAGVLLAAKLGTVAQSVGPPYLLPAFAACFLGSTQLKPGRFNVWGTLLALLLLATGVTGLQLAGGDLWLTDLFNGLALVGAVSIAVVVGKRKSGTGRS